MKELSPSGKVFNTRMLIGEEVTVIPKLPGVKCTGTMIEYFERNHAIVLKDYTEWRMKDGKWEIEDEGDLLIIKGDGWAEIKVKRLSKRKKEYIDEIGKF